MKTSAKPARDYTPILICLGALVALGALLWFFPLVGIFVVTLLAVSAVAHIYRYGSILAVIPFAIGAVCFFGYIYLLDIRHRVESENREISFALKQLELDPGNRLSIDTLSKFGPRSKRAVPLLVDYLSTAETAEVSVHGAARRDAEARVVAAPGLKPWERVQVTDSNDPALTEQMRDTALDRETDRLAELYRNSAIAANEENRIAAIQLLGKIGPDARAAIPLLKEIAESAAAEQTRAAAQQALSVITARQAGRP